MHRNEIDCLDWRLDYWVPAVVSPRRNWAGMPGSRKGARYVIDRETLHASRDAFSPFDSQLNCLQWIMRHRDGLNQHLPGANVRAVRLDRWLLGLD